MTRPVSEDVVCSRSLADSLESAISAMWPRRARQELLLDLGERKGWDSTARREAIEDAASWLVRELALPPRVEVKRERGEADGERRARELARVLGEMADARDDAPGVARWVCGIAPALGTSAKTLANSLQRPLRADRCDHRWLRAIARAAQGEGDREAWCFHSRSAETMVDPLAALGVIKLFDAGDALVVLSLLALWQRRRPTSQAKGNRGQPRSRRATPKPVAALLGGLAQPAQTVALVQLARHLQAGGGRDLGALAIETALTEAHLAAHPSRATTRDAPSPTSGEAWLMAVERALDVAGDLVTASDRAVTLFRIARMRAWRDGRAQSVVDRGLARHPYVAASLALEKSILDPSAANVRFVGTTPGLLMLLPGLRSRGLLEEP